MKARNRVLVSGLFFITALGFADEPKSQPSQTPSSQNQASKDQLSQGRASNQQPGKDQGPYNQQAGDVGGEDVDSQTDVEKRQQADNSAWENTMGAPGSVGVSDSRGGFSPSQVP